MADQALPLIPSVPSYRVTTVLGEDPFVLDVRWNARDEAWYMDIRLVDETLLAAGIKLVLGALLTSRYTDARLPDGILVAVDLTGKSEDAGLDDMGDRVMVYFTPSADLES